MIVTLSDTIEICSPIIGVGGCLLRLKRNGKDKITSILLIVFAFISLLNGYAVYLSYIPKNNIKVYTLEQALILITFSYITFLLIKKKLLIFFVVTNFFFVLSLAFQLKKFDPTHSINGVLSGIYSYSMVLFGLISFIFITRGNDNIKDGYQNFALWFSTSIVLYYVSTFLVFISVDYLQYIDIELTYTLLSLSTYALLLFFLLIFVGLTRREVSKSDITQVN